MTKPNEFQGMVAEREIRKCEEIILRAKGALDFVSMASLTHSEKRGIERYVDWILLDALTALRAISPAVKIMREYDTSEPEDLPF